MGLVQPALRHGGNNGTAPETLHEADPGRLAPFNWLALLAAFGVGLASWRRAASAGPTLDLPAALHLGLFAVLFTLGVHCLIFIYFLGTGRG